MVTRSSADATRTSLTHLQRSELVVSLRWWRCNAASHSRARWERRTMLTPVYTGEITRPIRLWYTPPLGMPYHLHWTRPMTQLEHIEAIERRLWGAADQLRANSNYASNEYFLPVMGLVFLRHAYSRYLAVKDNIGANLPTRGGKTRSLTKEDFSQQSAIFLREKAQFDHLVSLPDSEDRAKAISAAMDSIEADYDSLRGVLPKGEYQELDNDVLGQLLRTLNPDALKQVSGDVFGRIYEYFLTQFADQKAHDGGEFFTPISLVSLIAHVLDPDRGTVLDPACGSGGMFVQSARTVEEQGQIATERLTFRGLEKNATTIRLAKMNLAVHGLEGDIQQAITYYEDPHELVGKADYLMANPPFNVDEIDAAKVKTDPRLPFGLPGVNKKGKVSNGNYVWISYFYSYLSKKGRAGFVMSSQASNAGDGEAKVRQKLVETGDVAVMIAIRSNFFYTRSVPCELWFFNRNKPTQHRDKVLMLDARNVYRKVTRKIYDFSPRAAAETVGHRLALPRRDRAIPGISLPLPGTGGGRRRVLFQVGGRRGRGAAPLAGVRPVTDCVTCAVGPVPQDPTDNRSARRTVQRVGEGTDTLRRRCRTISCRCQQSGIAMGTRTGHQRRVEHTDRAV